VCAVSVGDPFGLGGQVLDGQFRVDRAIGEGGFSVVYKGHHVGLDEPIAIKCLKLPGALGSAVVESFVRRFRDESRIHYRLSQGNLHIARAIASGTTMAPATGALVPYMVLEWLAGRSLAADFMERRAKGLRGRSMSEAIKVLDPAVDALAHAHAKGVVHRDINPGNLFLCESQDGTKLKVLDFGVAKIVSDHALEMGPRAVTLGHIRIFSPAYAAPEQFEDKIGKIGPWTDVYALTLVLLEALRDKGVNDGEHLGEFAMRALDEDHRPTPRSLGVSVGDEVEALLARAVSLSIAERPQDAGELWGMLKHAVRKDFEEGKPPHAHRVQSIAPRASAMPHDTFVLQAVEFPAVEVVRAPGSIAPPQPSAPMVMGMAPAKPQTERPRAHASTVRMENRPRLPGENDAQGDVELSPHTLRTGEIVEGRLASALPPRVSSDEAAPGGVWLRAADGARATFPSGEVPTAAPTPSPRSRTALIVVIVTAAILVAIALFFIGRFFVMRRAGG
jgi:serine/threonine protein kinase